MTLTAADEDEMVFRALQAGANCYLLMCIVDFYIKHAEVAQRCN